jgi:hypothetical protein
MRRGLGQQTNPYSNCPLLPPVLQVNNPGHDVNELTASVNGTTADRHARVTHPAANGRYQSKSGCSEQPDALTLPGWPSEGPAWASAYGHGCRMPSYPR